MSRINPDALPIDEFEGHTAVRVNGRVFDHAPPKILVPLIRRLPGFKLLQKKGNALLTVLTLYALLFEVIEPGLSLSVLLLQIFEPSIEPVLLTRLGCVNMDFCPHPPAYLLNFTFFRRNLLVDFAGVIQKGKRLANIRAYLCSAAFELTVGCKEFLLEALFIKCRRRAFLPFLIFAVAAPDCFAVFVGGMPDLLPIKAAAVCADDFAGKNAGGADGVAQLLPAFDLSLDKVELFGADDPLMISLNVVLRDFAAVELLFLCEEINGEGLLQQGVPLVFLIGENALDG